MEEATIILLFFTLFTTSITSTTTDTIRSNQFLRDGDTIVSSQGEFELGFFSPGSSKNRYLGIWYKKISYGTVVWVANRETPLTNHSGIVKVNRHGITVLDVYTGTKIWSSNSSRPVMNSIAQLLDTGNLVFGDENDVGTEKFIWQSFDYPSDNILPGMKVGMDLITGLNRYFTSWKNVDDPSPGGYMYGLDPNGFPQFFKWKGSVLRSRAGPWVGSQFSGDPVNNPNWIFTQEFVINKEEIYYKFDLVNQNVSATARFMLSPNGDSEVLVWNDHKKSWIIYTTVLLNDCDHFGLCGAYGCCKLNNSPRCECLRGFVPKFPGNWEVADWSDGCVRETQLDCGNGDSFTRYSDVKLPDTRNALYNMSTNLDECRRVCFKSCSCTAYANADVRRGGSGCLLWFNELIDTTINVPGGQDLYVRISASELGYAKERRIKRRVQMIVVPVVPTIVLVLLFLVFKNRSLKRGVRSKFSSGRTFTQEEDLNLQLFDFKQIANATNNFSHKHKLGKGGFGPVYKGILEDGKEVAVKRLSDDSGQGVDEFKNEVSYIAKLQHRNLVSLIGCCTEKGERILIYEYMPNKSLDSFIWDEDFSQLLDWPTRYNIINGIAKGLLYLHQDSKLRIIHRDLKPSNILLDHEMNPKISDFGTARSLGGTQTEASTNRVVGTYGYMAPEYALDGQFSVKSDVYSFGVLLIEIVTGKKNRLFNHPDHSLNLLGHAWKSYNEDKLLGLIDGTILESNNHKEVFRVIQIGLLCVQQYPEDRPSMSHVFLMLSSNIELPRPKQPGYFTERKLLEADYSVSKPLLSSSNQLTVTVLEPRL